MDQEPGGSQHPEYVLTEKVLREVAKDRYPIDISKLDERSVIGLRGLIRHLADEADFYRKKTFKRR